MAAEVLDRVDPFAVVQHRFDEGVVLNRILDHIDRYGPAIDHMAHLTVMGMPAAVGSQIAHEHHIALGPPLDFTDCQELNERVGGVRFPRFFVTCSAGLPAQLLGPMIDPTYDGGSVFGQQCAGNTRHS